MAQSAESAEDKIRSEKMNLINKKLELEKEKRLKFYKKPDFMMSFLKYMCQWAAINGLSGEYLISAENARKKAIEYLKESPTIDEALTKTPELAKNMQVMLNKDLLQSGEAIANLKRQNSLLKETT